MTNNPLSRISILKADGEREFFSREKLRDSLLRAGASSGLIDKIVSHIEKELINDMTTSDIYHHAFSLLHEHKQPIAARYSLRRALMGLGPTGFPFEEYVAEIFKRKGFSTETDRIVNGKCVAHEVDVVAYTPDKLIMCEVKFHNELGYKSDLKVALYVQARMEDIREAELQYAGKMRKLDEGWLVTNTKFSLAAIQYGECKGLRMIGWNYPKKGNLQDLIEEGMLHPLTCLTTLSGSLKTELFKKGIVLCKTLKDDTGILKSLGLNEKEISDTKHEMSMIC